MEQGSYTWTLVIAAGASPRLGPNRAEQAVLVRTGIFARHYEHGEVFTVQRSVVPCKNIAHVGLLTGFSLGWKKHF